MTVGLQLLLLFKFQISHTSLNFKIQISRLAELYALLVSVHVHYFKFPALIYISNFKSPASVIRDTPSRNSTSISTTAPPTDVLHVHYS